MDEYTWRDLYTQCVVTNFLLAVQTDLPYEDDFCEPRAEQRELTAAAAAAAASPRRAVERQLSRDTMRLLERYLTDAQTLSVASDYG